MFTSLRVIVLKAKAFVIKRAFPVCLLWQAIGLGTLLLPHLLGDALPPANTSYQVALRDFVDHRLFTLLFMGLGVLLVLFSALRLVMTYGAFEEHNESEFMARIWDELSGAATHIAGGTLALWSVTSPAGEALPLSFALYLAAGLVMFKGPSRPEPPAAA